MATTVEEIRQALLELAPDDAFDDLNALSAACQLAVLEAAMMPSTSLEEVMRTGRLLGHMQGKVRECETAFGFDGPTMKWVHYRSVSANDEYPTESLTGADFALAITVKPGVHHFALFQAKNVSAQCEKIDLSRMSPALSGEGRAEERQLARLMWFAKTVAASAGKPAYQALAAAHYLGYSDCRYRCFSLRSIQSAMSRAERSGKFVFSAVPLISSDQKPFHQVLARAAESERADIPGWLTCEGTVAKAVAGRIAKNVELFHAAAGPGPEFQLITLAECAPLDIKQISDNDPPINNEAPVSTYTAGANSGLKRSTPKSRRHQ